MVFDTYMGQSVNSCQKLVKYEENRLSSKLSYEILVISKILTDCFDELAAMAKIDEASDEYYRLFELKERYEFLIEIIKDKSDELKSLSKEVSE